MNTVITLRNESDAFRLEAIISSYLEHYGFTRNDGTETSGLLFHVLGELNNVNNR